MSPRQKSMSIVKLNGCTTWLSMRLCSGSDHICVRVWMLLLSSYPICASVAVHVPWMICIEFYRPWRKCRVWVFPCHLQSPHIVWVLGCAKFYLVTKWRRVRAFYYKESAILLPTVGDELDIERTPQQPPITLILLNNGFNQDSNPLSLDCPN